MNGNGERLIERKMHESVQPRAVLTILWLPDGQVRVNFPKDEIITRYLLDKARSILDDEFRKRNALAQPPRIVT